MGSYLPTHAGPPTDVCRPSRLHISGPEVTRQRLYLETLSEVIPQLGGKVILDADAKQFLPFMNLQQFNAGPDKK